MLLIVEYGKLRSTEAKEELSFANLVAMHLT
jgi:hypothetical protein